jgi:pyruvate,water dikinase
MSPGAPRWVYPFGPGRPALEPADKDALGGKGASLAAMSRAGLPVPPGFTITTACCRAFLENGHQWPAGLAEEVRQQLAELERATNRRYGRGPTPLLVSVRSGAAVSMPGMMDTLLNCGLHPGLADELGDTPEFWSAYLRFIRDFAQTAAEIAPEAFGGEAAEPASRRLAQDYLDTYQRHTGRPFPTDPWMLLCECINAVFRSWNTARAVAYRQRDNVRGVWGTAVNVQAMFPSQVSGVLFTQDPNQLAANRMVLEASYGLGEAVVSGDVTPDRFLVARGDFREVEACIGERSLCVAAAGNAVRPVPEATLTPEQIADVCAIGLQIEQHFGQPMDIEWGWADGHWALLQCRPIRGLEVARDVEVGRLAEIERLQNLAGRPGRSQRRLGLRPDLVGTESQPTKCAQDNVTRRVSGVGSRRRLWVAHNLGETLRAPTPLTWDIVRGFMSGKGGFGRFYQDLGYRPSARVCQEGFLELIGGRIYADPDRLAQLFWGDGPLRYDLAAVQQDRSLLDQAPTRFDPERADGMFFLRLPGMVGSMFRAARIAKRLRDVVGDRFEKEVLPPYLDYVREKRAEDLSRLEIPQVCAELRARCAHVLDEFGKESLKPGYFGALAFTDLRRRLVQLMGVKEGGRLAGTLTMGLDGDTTVAQNQLLYQVARGEATVEQFLDAYGHRTVGEMELAEPRYREQPQQLTPTLDALRRSRCSPEDIHREHATRRAEVEKDLPRLLAHWGGSSFREQIETSLRQAQQLLAYRESGKHYLMMGYELIRLAILELARRWQLGREVFFLRQAELECFDEQREQLLETVAARQIRWQALQRLDMPDVIDSQDLARLGLPRRYESAAELPGDAVAPGVAAGTARIVLDPRENRDLGVDYILVCPSTDPGWTSLFVNARGLIVERGGVLSHGAIVARDFGIPAVVCPGATSRIQDGSKVRVDGNQGKIHVDLA